MLGHSSLLFAAPLVVLAIILVGVLCFMHERIRHEKAARKILAFLRDPSKWENENPHDPCSQWGSLVYHLNNGESLPPFQEIYARADRIGSTPEELWDIHRSAHRHTLG